MELCSKYNQCLSRQHHPIIPPPNYICIINESGIIRWLIESIEVEINTISLNDMDVSRNIAGEATFLLESDVIQFYSYFTTNKHQDFVIYYTLNNDTNVAIYNAKFLDVDPSSLTFSFIATEMSMQPAHIQFAQVG